MSFHPLHYFSELSSVVIPVLLISEGEREISVMTGTVLFVFGSCERHSELTEEMYIPLRPIPKEDALRR